MLLIMIFPLFQDHIFKLMKSDSYSRYLRSDMYKEFLSGTRKKVRLLPAITNFSAFKHTWHFISLMLYIYFACIILYDFMLLGLTRGREDLSDFMGFTRGGEYFSWFYLTSLLRETFSVVSEGIPSSLEVFQYNKPFCFRIPVIV